MSLRVYNTMSGQKEDFQPLVPGKVSMYVCGVTVYDYCHIGHARAMLSFDLIYRWLVEEGNDVTFVRNYTDLAPEIDIDLGMPMPAMKVAMMLYGDPDRALELWRGSGSPTMSFIGPKLRVRAA